MAEAPSAQAVAALATVMSLVAALLKRGVIDQTAVDDALRDACKHGHALCGDCREAEPEVQRLLDVIGETAAQIAATEAPPIPLVDPE
jgi:hypothetical protein